MHRLRKYFRGSGRVLAVIFVASVIWLIFDMAALRLSFNEGTSKLQREVIFQRDKGSVDSWRPPARGQDVGNPPRAEDSTKLRGIFYPLTDKHRMSPAPKANANLMPRQRKRTIPALKQPANKTIIVPMKENNIPVSAKDTKEQDVNATKVKEHPPTRLRISGRLAVSPSSSSPAPTPGAVQNVGKPVDVGDKKSAGDSQGHLAVTLQVEDAKNPQDIIHKYNNSSSNLHKLHPLNPKHKENPTEVNKLNYTHNQLIIAPANNQSKVINNKQVGSNVSITVKLSQIPVLDSRNVTVKQVPFSPNLLLSAAPVMQNISKTRRSKEGFLGKLESKGKSVIKMNKTITSVSVREIVANGQLDGIHSIDNKPLLDTGKEVVVSKAAALHQVLAVDTTNAPRDPKAPGQFGRPLAVPKEKEAEAKRRWKEGYFNVYLSDMIPLDRAIEDTRPKGCSEQLVHDDLPTTSIIMCFVDEVWSTLIRSVFSVLNRSPAHLVKEIILVDDFSTKDYLKDKLDTFLLKLPKVRVLHLKERHGLIRARIAGANIATGDVLTYLDSHVECNVGWLEPLLEQVRVNRKKVACPVIEVISDKDMSYMTVDSFQRGIFSWPMNFGWKPIPQEVLQKNKITEMDPIRCPVMAGGLFSIDKKYFYELGTYDPGLDVWGGENMEISFKIWMCGGEIEIIPCSRVGHIFRNDNPYSFPKDRVKTVERNLVRVAEVWLDEYKELFYGHGYHLLLHHPNIGNLTQQKELRKKLQCKSFKWYIENVYPDLDAPLVRATGVVSNLELGKCLSIENSTLVLELCDASKQNQHFDFTWLRLIKQNDFCIAPSSDKTRISLHPCNNTNGNLRWLHTSLAAFQPSLKDHFVLESIPQPTCLDVDKSHNFIRMNDCDPTSNYQKWAFEKYFAK